MKYLLLLCFIPALAYSQGIYFTPVTSPDVAGFKSILRKSPNQYENDTTQAIRYPIVITNNDAACSKINSQIKTTVFAGLFKDAANRQAIDLLDSFITVGLNKMSYKTTFNNKGILSLTINYQSCGAANCVDTAVILNFDINTGNALTIEDVISKDNLPLFMKNVQVDKTDALNKYKTDLQNQLTSKDIGKDDYNAATLIVTNCLNSVQLKNFILNDNAIEIIDPCEFPHSLQDFQPSYQLIYPYTSIKSLLTAYFEEKVF